MAQRAATYREVFAVREFQALFTAHLLSVIGDQFARVALAVLVYARTGSAALTALTYALTVLPQLIAGPLLGGLADRYPRRRIMIATDLARAVLVAAMATPDAPLAVIGALLVAVQLLAAPFNAARAATLPLVLEGDRYVVASAVSNMTYQLALLLGFASGGLLVSTVHPSGALLIDAATFVLSAAVISLGIAARPAPGDGDPAGHRGWLGRMGAGLRLVWTDRALRALVALLCIAAFPVVAEGLAVPYAADLHAGPTAMGLLLAANPTGGLLGMLLIRRLPPAQRLLLMRPLAVTSCAVLIACAARPGLAPTMALWAISGACMGYFLVANAALVQAGPDQHRGQVFGLVSTALQVTQGAAVLVAGTIADLIAPALVIAATGAIGTVAAWAAATMWIRAAASSNQALADKPQA
jgi:Major Facilitator Superfamily